MRLQSVILGFLVAAACPLDGYAQYDIVTSSIQEEQTTLSNGDSARRQTFQILPRQVARYGYKNYLVTLIRDDTGLVWLTFEGADNIQTTKPGRNWPSPEWIVARSKDGRSLVGLEECPIAPPVQWTPPDLWQ
jgi:hypothetical protein